MSSGSQTHNRHSRTKTTIHVGNVQKMLMHIKQLTEVVSIHLAVFDVIVQSLFQCHTAAEYAAIRGHSEFLLFDIRPS